MKTLRLLFMYCSHAYLTLRTVPMRSIFLADMPLSLQSCETEVPCFAAIEESVSPDLILYDAYEPELFCCFFFVKT